jgi:hypothetical protein
MKSFEERGQREYERREIIRKAVEAADNIILDGSDGSVEETDWLTSQVAKGFVEKVDMAISAKLTRKELGLMPEEYFAIFSSLIDKVIGVCTSEGRPSVEASESGCKFVSITKHQFDTFGEDPEDEWTQLDQIGIEKPK